MTVRLSVSRRQFLKTSWGAAATLLAFNHLWARLDNIGGSFFIPEAAATEPEAAEDALGGSEIIIDLQNFTASEKDGSFSKEKYMARKRYNPSFQTCGPKTPAHFAALRKRKNR